MTDAMTVTVQELDEKRVWVFTADEWCVSATVEDDVAPTPEQYQLMYEQAERTLAAGPPEPPVITEG